ncbi:DUF1996 domain-containing protein [Candidatus Saccharibacteria bacterium]|nr:MAG: DUF1996 domain-containing protein [Candidatus Saccharibacteria bacterium]
MTKSKKRFTKLKRLAAMHRQKLIVAMNVAAFAGLGALLLVFTQAATPTRSVEGETGSAQGGASVLAASGASAGLAVRFGQTTSNNDLGSFLYNSTLGSRWRQYENSSETEIEQNLTSRGNLEANPGGYQTHNSQGQFRFFCQYSHFNYDDPIVYPPINGVPQVNKAHLHMFWGNSRMDASTTDANIMTRGGSSCAGFEANRSGYWMPAVLDGSNRAVIPDNILIYYKSALNAAAQTKVKPQGLKMIAGNAKGNTDSSLFHVNGVIWACYTGSLNYTYVGSTIPDNCPANTRENAVNSYTKQKDPNAYNSADTFPIKLQALVFFPACVKVDGSGKPVLDSPDHKSHVAYFSGSSCPSTHPYMMPQVSYHVSWSGTLDYSQWKLSSDAMAGVADGFSLHADWYGGWTTDVMDHWIKGCINQQLNCSNGVMAPGGGYPHRQLKTVPNYSGPNYLTVPTP